MNNVETLLSNYCLITRGCNPLFKMKYYVIFLHKLSFDFWYGFSGLSGNYAQFRNRHPWVSINTFMAGKFNIIRFNRLIEPDFLP